MRQSGHKSNENEGVDDISSFRTMSTHLMSHFPATQDPILSSILTNIIYFQVLVLALTLFKYNHSNLS